MGKKPKSRSSKRRAARANTDTLPSKAEILEYIQSAPDRIGKREIARAFNIKGGARIGLKRILKEMSDEGLISGPRKRITRSGDLPSVCVIEITARDEHGEFIAQPASWQSENQGAPPQILVLPGGRTSGPAPGIGDRVLARIERLRTDETEHGLTYRARVMKRLERERDRLLGIFRSLHGGSGLIAPINRKQLKEWPVSEGDTNSAIDGELVRFELGRGGRYGVAKVKIVERLGDPEGQDATSLIAIHEHGIRDDFPDSVLAQAEELKPASLNDRDDMRNIPLITIDPADARDHDDAVWAEPDSAAENEGGWIVTVAIADVSWFVRPGSALDREALLRGNSVYFPDRVVPMLPEKISADLCSLREGEDRACLAVQMVFSQDGSKKSHRFSRGLMRSAARLSYDLAQSAIDGRPDDKTEPLLDTVLKPLWDTYAAIAKARDRRGPLELDIPERKIRLNDDGQIDDIIIPRRLDAHRLIEEFMIQANVAAAETLEAQRSPLIYRVHDAPSDEKLETLRDFLETLGLKLPKAGRLSPEQFNQILARADASGMAELVSEVVLRSQAQAEYSPANFGHFGLNLRRYAHFTSPIRRYADLVVHRALVGALDLGEGALSDGEIPRLDQISEAISKAERVAMAAERQTVDRLVAGYLADRIGSTFPARISGVVKSGLFVRLDQTGADGFVPASSILGDYYRLDESLQALVGDRSGLAFQLGDIVEVRLVEAIPTAGALRFEMLSEGRLIKGRARKANKGGRKKPVYSKRNARRRRR